MNEDVLNEIKKKVIEEIGERYEGETSEERFMYAVPYKSIPVTMPSTENELPIILNDVVLAVKQKIIDRYGNTTRIFELYGEDAQKIMETQDDGKVKFEREVLDELIQEKIKVIEEAGYEAAAAGTLTKDGLIESYFELLNKKLVVLNKEQKERLERSDDRERTLSDIADKNLDAEEDKKPEEQEQNQNNPEQNEKSEEQENRKIEAETGIDSIHKKVRMNDSIFKENTKADNVDAVLTHSGKLEFVKEENGKYERANEFGEGTSQTGRAVIARNDNKQMDTKNTYGEVSAKNADTKYSAVYDQYGGIQVIEKIESHGGHIEENERYVAREARSDNTNLDDRNLEGDNNKDNITAETFKRHSTNRNASYYGSTNGKGGVSEIAENIRKHGEPIDFTMEGFSADASLRINEALDMVHDELEDRGLDLDNNEEQKLQNKLKGYLGNNEHVFCKEEAEQYANEIQMEKNNKENNKEDKDKDSDSEGRSRLEEAMQRRR